MGVFYFCKKQNICLLLKLSSSETKSWKIIKWSVEQMQTAEPDFIFQSVYHQTHQIHFTYMSKKGFKESDLWHCVITYSICFSVFLKMSLNPLVFSVLTRLYDMSLFLCPLLCLHYGATVLRCFCNHVPKWNLTACKIFVRVYPVNQHYINKMRWHGDAVLALWPAATNSWVWIHRPALAFLRRAYMFSLCLCRFSPGTLAFPYSPKTCLLD